MGESTKIQWCDHTFNTHWGCSKVAGDPACDRCYAERFAHRLGLKLWGDHRPRRTFGEKHWAEPLKWDGRAAKEGRRARVFCSSMADVFENREDLDETRARLWALIEATPNLDWLLLTKRPENIRRMLAIPEDRRANVWLGTTAVTQRHYNERVAVLCRIPAAVHFVSIEPMVEWVTPMLSVAADPNPDWIICGGESGHGARPFNVGWARQLARDCERLGIAFFLKQLGQRPEVQTATGPEPIPQIDRVGGDPSEWPEPMRIREFPHSRFMNRERGLA